MPLHLWFCTSIGWLYILFQLLNDFSCDWTALTPMHNFPHICKEILIHSYGHFKIKLVVYVNLPLYSFCRLQELNLMTLTYREGSLQNMMRRESVQLWFPISVQLLMWWSRVEYSNVHILSRCILLFFDWMGWKHLDALYKVPINL